MTTDIGVSVERTAELEGLWEITWAEIMEALMIPQAKVQHNVCT